jgi:hypothetical protein
MLKAHRVAWELHYFWPIPEGLCVLHHCDTPRCVNIECLFLGTDADNAADREAKSRGNQAKGSANGTAKLTEGIISEIRRRLAEGESQEEIGRRFGVHQTKISNIKTGKAWSHV